MSNFLILGAGFVAEPVVEYLSRKDENQLTVASYLLEEAQQVANKYSGVKCLQVNVSNPKELELLIKDYDLVVSLVPAPFHPLIAQSCINAKTHMVTASYESPEMKVLSEEAKDAGISILNEIGLDPGIDHLSAMQIIDQAHAKGHKIDTFVSWCGGLPAPESNNNPLGYKFSWAPKGVLMALLNEAVYLQNNQVLTVSAEDLMSWTKPLNINGLELEGYPNRESVSYKKVYEIPESKNILRGTLRYQGFSKIIQVAKSLGLLSLDTLRVESRLSWKDFIQNINSSTPFNKLKSEFETSTWNALEWIGCFSEKILCNPNNLEKTSAIDLFCELLKQKLNYLDNEKDMVVLQHKFVIKNEEEQDYYISSTLKIFGEVDGCSAMSKTVGYPAAIASQLIADNKIQRKGVILPVTKEIYEPILDALKEEGVECIEESFSKDEVSKKVFLSELL